MSPLYTAHLTLSLVTSTEYPILYQYAKKSFPSFLFYSSSYLTSSAFYHAAHFPGVFISQSNVTLAILCRFFYPIPRTSECSQCSPCLDNAK
mmetsp:Transcript_22621/g.31924  ORF Transcript_22621/g.31924 Transcript_22621/m.31924 type:complete len:92 (-) Transcript_22621:179-454(-)